MATSEPTASASQVTCATFPVLDCKIDMPLRGTWIATLTLDADIPPTGHVDITITHEDSPDVDIFHGTVLYGYPWQGRSKLTVVGGKGGLTLPEVTPQNYIGSPIATPISILLNDIMAQTSEVESEREVLEGSVFGSLAEFSLGRWQRVRSGAGRALTMLADVFGLGWRVLADGTVWMGAETWPVIPLGPYDISDDGVARILMVAPERATWRPGTIILDKRVNRVVYILGEEALRAELHYGVGTEAKSDRSDAEGFVRTMLPELPYAKSYLATVLLQEENGDLVVRCDDATMGELAAVPFYVGVPGAKLIIEANSRVSIHFASASPDSYYATGLNIEDSSTANVSRVGDTIQCGYLAFDPVAQSLVFSPVFVPPPAVPLVGTITSGYKNVKLPKP